MWLPAESARRPRAPRISCTRRRLALSLLLLSTCPTRALAQLAGPGGHPLPTGPRPPHAIVAEADAAAIGTIDGGSAGRVRVRDAQPIYGAPGAVFEIKRAPSSPPALADGERRVLLLRGGRSPYLLVGAPRDQLAITGADADARATLALRQLRDALVDSARLRELYLRWVEGADDELRVVGLRGLSDAEAPFHPIPDADARHHAARAVDASLGTEPRKASAVVAGLVPAGVDAMLAPLPLATDPAGTAVYEIALATGLLRKQAVPVLATLERALAHPSADVRRIALRYSRGVVSPAITRALERIAASDADESLRAEAAKRLAEARPAPAG